MMRVPAPANIQRRQQAYLRKASLYNERSSFFSQYLELSQFYLPRNGRWMVTDRNRGDKRFNHIYDSTGTRAVRVLGAGLLAGMTSPARPWMRLQTGIDDLDNSTNVKLWLSRMTKLMLAIFEQSNTYRTLHSMYEELAVFATGCSLVLPDFDDVIRHYPMTVGEYAFGMNERNEVDTLARAYDMTVSQIVKRFVQMNPKSGSPIWSNVSPTIKNLWDTGRGLDSWVQVVQLIEPRVDRQYGSPLAKDMPWSACSFEAAQSNDVFLEESGYKDFPVLAPRWAALGGDIYGTTCPGMESLGDVKQLQHGQLRKAQGIDYMVKPPLQLPSSMAGREPNMLPGGSSYVDMVGPNSGIKSAWDVRIDLSGQLEDIQDIRQRINANFSVDLFLMLANDDRSGITAREVAERHEEKLLMLGPVLERLHNELLKQFINMTLDHMVRAGIVPQPPQEMQGAPLKVKFTSMLAQAQAAVGTQSIDHYLGSIGTVAQFKPEVLDKIDVDQYADIYGDLLGIDPRIIVASDKVAIIREQRAQKQAQQQQLQNQEQQANIAATAAQANPDVMQGLTGYTTPGA